MYLVDDEERALADAARQFLDKSYGFQTRKARLGDGRGQEDWRALATTGWLGMLIPEALGGGGCSLPQVCGVLEAFGGALHLEPIIPVAVEAAAVLLRCSPSELAEDLLTRLVAGETRAVLLADIAIEVADGEICGMARAVAGAASATHFLAPTAGGGLLVIEASSGAICKPLAAIDGSDLADVVIRAAADDAPMLQCGHDAIAEAQALGRLAACAWVQGIMETAIHATAAYVGLRSQFGHPLAGFQSVRHRLADMRMAADAARAALRRASATGDRRAIEAAYVVSLDAAIGVAETSIQLHGAMGVTEDMAPAHQYRTVLRIQAHHGSPASLARDLGGAWLS